jgi:antitoxin (DNA-binding transcriptional repressor) of toxin-antitoxin stability system
MKRVSVGDFKAHFSALLDEVLEGKKIAIQYGRKKEIVAWLVPARQRRVSARRPLGLLEGKASFKVRKDFKMTEEELLGG